MSTIRIKRSNEHANRLRDIKILLDGVEIGRIANSETKDFKITSGNHLLQAKIDWCTSNMVELTVSANDLSIFNLDSFAKHTSLGIFSTIYFITFGAKKYLHLTKAST